jgi:hypothetical protein
MTASKEYMTCSKHEKTPSVVEKLGKCIGLPLHLYSDKDVCLRECLVSRSAQVETFVSKGLPFSFGAIAKVESISAYPLSMVLIRDKVAAGVFTKNHTAENYPYFFPEALTQMDSVWNIGIQHFSPEDLVWLTGGTDKIKSMPISVFSFTLHGSCVEVCDPELFSGPFVSYIKEDDDYDTMVKRLGVITGEIEAVWNAYNLAVVSNKTPFFIPRATTRTPALAPVLSTSMAGVSCLQSSCCINNLNFCVRYLCHIGWVYVFYVGHVDRIDYMKSFSIL